MAQLVSAQKAADPDVARRVSRGELGSSSVSFATIKRWVQAWQQRGLMGLVDGRMAKDSGGFDTVDPRFRRVTEQLLAGFNGDASIVNIRELRRRIDVEIKRQGLLDVQMPQRATGRYLPFMVSRLGSTTRAQRSRAQRKVSGSAHYPAIRPGQVIAIDATRADNLVFDPLTGRVYSVEILTAIDVCTRVIVALRVTPRSADGIDAGLLLYDAMRPFSQVVTGTSISDWRWTGLPEQLQMPELPLYRDARQARRAARQVAGAADTVQGEHKVPAVQPAAIRCDRGSIFLSDHFYGLLRDFGIDLLPSRGSKPTDNPHVERWHETLQRGLQQWPGYKGRSVSERGRVVGLQADQPLLTAAELQAHLRRFVALDYHRTWHQGLVLPGDPAARLSPLEMFDVMLDVTGRIDVPQRPDLLYQFLPIRWGVIRHAGVEFRNLVYDSPVLDPYRNARRGELRDTDGAAPFFCDPHDVSRIWFRDPATGQVCEIGWRGAHLFHAPMTEAILTAARSRIRDRGGNLTLSHDSAQRQILAELTDLTDPGRGARDLKHGAQLSAAGRRVERSRADHAEAQDRLTHQQTPPDPALRSLPRSAGRRADLRPSRQLSAGAELRSIYDDDWAPANSSPDADPDDIDWAEST
jgi:transposase InsO family protein